MSLTAALRGFVVVLCWFAGIHSQTWGVEYASKHICAFEGSTVEISCTFKYPPWINDKKTVVQRAFWFTKLKDNNPLDLREDPYYAGRVTYHFSEKNSMLRIRGLKRSDFAEYKFRFETNQPGGSSTGSPGVFLTATGVYGSSCNKVSYTERSICAFRGSTVTISCSFQSESSDSLESWFSVRGQQHYYQNTGGHDSSENRFQVKMYRDQSSLTISDLTDSDADEYRCKTTWWGRDFPGTTLTVVDPGVQVIRSGQELVCHSSCFPLHHLSFIWFMNGQEVQGETSDYYRKPVSPEASYSCSYQGHRSPEVYAPKSVSVSMSLPEIMEGSSVTLTCSCDANPAAKFRWYKNNQPLLRKDPSLILRSVQRSDSGKYHCVAENELGEAQSDYVFINVECESNKGTRLILQIFLMFDLH
uniref:Ig-like domain-containing protein n=1 Tax=Oryzias latipes TaxID=8090 RepID=A0A3P9IF96_ORYLA